MDPRKEREIRWTNESMLLAKENKEQKTNTD